jgi:hypothetical protein
MSQLANHAELMILSESKPTFKLHMKPLMRPGFRKPKVKKVSWSEKLITEHIVSSTYDDIPIVVHKEYRLKNCVYN